MTYSIELDPSDITFIKACVLGAVRRAQDTMKESDAIKVTMGAVETITRLNEARMTHLDVMFINTCIEKTREHLKTDTYLPETERHKARKLGEQIQNKLAGVGAKRNVFES